MKRHLLLISILALVLLPMGCVDTQGILQGVADNIIQQATGTYTIKVCSNTTGLNFTGEYSVFFCDWNPDTERIDYTEHSYSVEGQVPEEYTFEGMTAAGLFQKQTGDETLLSVEIWKDEVLIDSSDTTDPWGAVLIAAGL